MISVPCGEAIFAAFGPCSWELLNNVMLSLTGVNQGPICMQVSDPNAMSYSPWSCSEIFEKSCLQN